MTFNSLTIDNVLNKFVSLNFNYLTKKIHTELINLPL